MQLVRLLWVAQKTLSDKRGVISRMSNGSWRTKPQIGQSPCGKSITQRVESYIRTWERRCYGDGIPDEVPRKLMAVMRAPSYKAIAIAILHNDVNLYGLGLDQPSFRYWLESQEQHPQAKLI